VNPLESNLSSKEKISQEQLQRQLATSLAEALYLNASDVDVNKSFIDLGLDSIVGVEWLNTINKKFKIAIPASVVYDYPTIEKLASFLHTEVNGKENNFSEAGTYETADQNINPVAVAPISLSPSANVVASNQSSTKPKEVIPQEQLQRQLAASLAEALYMSTSDVDVEKSFIELGLDSIVGVEWLNTINKKFKIAIPASVVYDYPTIEKLASFLYTDVNDKGSNVETTVDVVIANNSISEYQAHKYQTGESQTSIVPPANFTSHNTRSLGTRSASSQVRNRFVKQRGIQFEPKFENQFRELYFYSSDCSGNFEKDGELSVNYIISVENNVCLRDHKVFGEYLLPTDAYIEMIYTACKTYFSIDQISLKDISIINPLLGFPNRENHLRIVFSKHGDGLQFKIKSSISSNRENEKIHMQGFVHQNHAYEKMTSRLATKPGSSSMNEVENSSLKNLQKDVSVGDFYSSIQKLSFGNNFALAQLKVPDHGLHFLLDPTILFAGLTTTMFFGTNQLSKQYEIGDDVFIPSAIDNISVNGIINGSTYYCYAEIIQIEKDKVKLYFEIVDQSYRPVLVVESISIQRVSNKIIRQMVSTTKNGQTLNGSQPNVNVGNKKKSEASVDVAIIGMSCRYPKSENIEAFWQNLKNGTDCITEVPGNRWKEFSNWYHPDPYHAGTASNKWGGFIDDVDAFDPLFFGISPSDAEFMDPQQRIFLEECLKTIESAGYAPSSLSDQSCGVYVGCAAGDYGKVLAAKGKDTNGAAFLGTSNSILAARISYHLNLKGPSVAIDTACSSSLTAIHLACESIRNQENKFALAGGVTLMVTPGGHILTSQVGMQSKAGRCSTFDRSADGTVFSEGCGVVLLKSLPDAIRDNDCILGVIKASGTNQDGKTNGITAPSTISQTQLVSQLYEKYNIDPRKIGYVEAHGTGTIMGDPIEVAALTTAFKKFTSDKNFCAIGSVKSNIGHSSFAAGVSGLIKILLSIKYKKLVPSIHFEEPNPHINFDQSPFFVGTKYQDWQSDEPRLASISSFGFSGTNAHLVVEEYVPSYEQHLPVNIVESNTHVIPLSAKTAVQLDQKAKDLLSFIRRQRDQKSEIDLSSLAYTLQAGRDAMEYRLGFIVNSVDQLADKLHAYVNGKLSEADAYQGQVKRNSNDLGALIQDEEVKETIVEKLIAGKKLSKLLDLWIKGLEIKWGKLYNERKPRRISLPTYPFARERYWIEGSNVEQSTSTNVKIHPLLHNNTSDLNQQRYSTTFSGEEFFFTDHQVKGQKILPGVAYLEMARAAAQDATPVLSHESWVELYNTVWLQPVIGTPNKQVSIDLSVDEHSQIDFTIYSLDSEQELTHCQGKASFGVKPQLQKLDIQQLLEDMKHNGLDVSRFYSTYAAMGIMYGPAHKAVTELYKDDDSLLAYLSLPSVVEGSQHEYLLHPSIMDCALQSALGLIADLKQPSAGKPSLPFALEFLRILSPCTSNMIAWVRYAQDSKPLDKIIKLDVDLCDEEGNICVQMYGFSARQLEGEIGAQSQRQDEEEFNIGLQSLVPVWNSLPRRSQKQIVLSESTKILLIGTEERHVDWVQRSYPNTQYLQILSDSTVDFIQKKLSTYSFDQLVWIAPDVTHADDILAPFSSEHIIAEQEQGVLSVFRIIKALLQLEYTSKELQFTIITGKTQMVKNGEHINATHAGIFGLIGSVAKEFPQWNLRLLDVDSLNVMTAAECLSQDWDKQGNGLAYRQGEWFRQELASIKFTSQENPIYKNRGVYVVIGGAGGLGEVWTRFMIEKYQAKIVWIGRREANAEINDKINSLSEIGDAPLYISADATKLESLKEAFGKIVKTYPVINGVVHSAIVLQDQSMAHMDESKFRSSLSAKVDISVNIDKVFGRQDLDFMLFFSSIISFSKSPGQSNYAAGCTFKDSFAQSLNQQRAYSAKIINWGYWGNIGIVANESYKSMMEQMGIGSIEAEEGMASLEKLVNSDINQLALIKTLNEQVLYNFNVSECVTSYSKNSAAILGDVQKVLDKNNHDKQLAALEKELSNAELDSLQAEILASSLMSLGFFNNGILKIADLSQDKKTAPFYERWLHRSISYLQEQNWVNADLTFNKKLRELNALWAAWENKKAGWAINPNLDAQIVLLEACLKGLPNILIGKQLATDIMFPNSSMKLVEGIYKDNALADLYNEVLGETLKACIKQKLQADKTSNIRILEIGAGTGGTTAKLLLLLQEFAGVITEYCYTDVSKAFLMHAEQHYAPQFPALTTALFDVTKPLASQSIETDHYDLVIAANVLHATPNIRQTLRNTKAILKNEGVLLLNEISIWSLFTHQTFGLLEGWWLNEDTAVRIAGSPGITPEKWKQVLTEEGFHSVLFPASKAHKFGQQIIAASSDGMVRQPISRQSHPIAKKNISISEERPVKMQSMPAKVIQVSDNSTESLRARSISYFQSLVAETLKMKHQQLDPSRSLTEYGLDSILVNQLTTQLRKVFPGITSTLFFEVQSIEGLADYFLENKKDDLAVVLSGTFSEQLHERPVHVQSAKEKIVIASPNIKDSLREASISYLQNIVAETLKIKTHQLDPSKSLTEYGLDSILVNQLTTQLRKVFPAITSTLFFEVQSVEGLADYLIENKHDELVTILSSSMEIATAPQHRSASLSSNAVIHQERKLGRGRQIFFEVKANTQSNQHQSIFDVAIVGVSGRYPRSTNLKEFWDNLSKGVNCISEIPEDRWNWEEYYDPKKGKPDKMYTKWGGFLKDIDKFDPMFFKISPAEAEGIDPQERLFLETCYHAIEDAGYTPENLDKTHHKIGVFAGVMNSRYSPTPSYFSISNRVSYLFNFQGPSMTVDTACSSSLTAIHLALESLYSGLSSCAIAGGVNLIIDPVHYLRLTGMNMLSGDNQCKAFGANADGFIDAEGVGAVVLKSLRQAEQDGDHIYGVIKGSAVNAGGKTNGYTVPNPKAQSTLVSEALKRANISADQISYIEAHGTGTALGDPIEISALTRAFKGATDQKQFCAIGSSKSNIGHCESAAGIAALTKVLLQLKHEQLVPSLNAEEINPEIDFSQTPFKLQRSLEKWKRPTRKINGITKEVPRIAGISSFGAGGANVHLIVQEYLSSTVNQSGILNGQNAKVIIALSAKTKEQVKQRAIDLLDHIRGTENKNLIDLSSMAFTLQTGREAMEERLGFIVSSVDQLAEKIHAFISGDETIEDVYQGNVKSNKETLALFTGDTDLQEAIDKWIINKKLSKLVDLWVKGLDLDWSKLYSDSKVSRMSLPVYPFAKQRCWKDLQNLTGGNNHQIVSSLHPLVHINTSTFSEQRFTSTFTGEEFFLRDHKVGGEKVLPGVAYLEMACEAFRQASGDSLNGEGSHDKIIQLKNVVWARPIVVNGHPSNVNIRLMPDESGEIAYEVYTTSSTPEENGIVHSQGIATYADHIKQPILNLLDLQKQLNRKHLSPEECYEGFKGVGIDYGPAHKGIERVYIGESTQGMPEVLAKIKMPSSVLATKDQFILHPSLLDSVLQASIGINLGSTLNGAAQKPMLPFALESLEIIDRPSQELWAWIRHAAGSSSSSNTQKLNIDLCDDEGKVCARMKGFSSRVLNTEAASTKMDTIGTLMLKPVWKEKILSASDKQIEFVEHHILLCGLKQTSTALQAFDSQIGFDDLTPHQHGMAEQFQWCAEQLFDRVKKILEAKPTGNILLQVVVRDQNNKQIFSGLSGLLKTAHIENSKFFGQVIAVNEDIQPQDLITKLKADSQFADDHEIRYTTEGNAIEKRLVNSFEEVTAVASTQVLPWKEKGVYLITGGAGGLGFLFAKEIVTKTEASTIILTGRSVLSEEKYYQIKALEKTSIKIFYKNVDVADEKAVKQLVQEIQQEFGGLNGIIHSAGINRDNFIVKKSAEEFQAVLAPKVAGVFNLDEATKTLNLDFFVLFSSGAGVMGNAGQADYATANAFMDAFARSRNALVGTTRTGRTLAINWPLWKEGGMGVNKATEKMLTQSMGIVAMETSIGIQAFYQALASASPQVLVIAGLLQRIRQKYLSTSNQKVSQIKESITSAKATSTIDNNKLRDKIEQHVKALISEALKIKVEDLDADVQLSEFGFDSISLTTFANTLNERHKLELNPTVFFEYPTIESFAKYLSEAHQTVFAEMFVELPSIQPIAIESNEQHEDVDKQVEMSKPRLRFAKANILPAVEKPSVDPIAIVGVSGRFPGARDINEFWNNLVEGKHCIQEIPSKRWDWQALYGNPKENYKTNIKWGGFIDGIDEFDPQFFGISRKEAQYLDPLHRLLMTYIWSAVEDSGHSPLSLSGSKTGIFIGTGMSGYSDLFTGSNASADGFTPTGVVSSMGPNRMSYFLDLHGPSEPIETACSSSLIAINRAINAIETGSCDQAIVGGMNLMITPNGHIAFNKAGLLCEDGHCKTFSKDANGYVRGEGVGMIFLKKLKDAETDNDHIYALIRGGAENHGGRANSLTAPSPKAQSDVIMSAYKRAGVDPRTVSYIEAHGTGTLLGDSVEINGLKNAFDAMSAEIGNSSVQNVRCGLGSVKTNVGHLEFASGAVGIIKVVLQLQHKRLVKSLNCDELSPYINLKDSPFYVVQESKAWDALQDVNGNSIPRRAGVSAFGFGGVNAHIILEEYIASAEKQKESVMLNPEKPLPFVLSAKNSERLTEYVRNILQFIQTEHQIDLHDLVYTLQIGRDAMEERLGLMIHSVEELQEKLQSFIVGNTQADVYTGNIKRNKEAIAEFNTNEAKQKLIDQWLAIENVDKILDLWTKGLAFDWNKIYGEIKPKRISLPTYPFAREAYWVDTMNNGSVIENESSTAEVLQSLTHRANTATEKIELFLKQLVAQQLQVSIENIDVEESFFELGVDSLGVTNLIGKTNHLLQENLMPSVVFEHTTTRKLATFLTETFPGKIDAAIIDKAHQSEILSDSLAKQTDSVWTKAMNQAAETNQILVPMQTAGEKLPIFAVPGVGGSVLCFQPLSQSLGNDQPFYGLQAVGLDGRTPLLDSVKEIAKANIAALKAEQSAGPYTLLGYSYGGVIAFEMAKILLKQKEKVASLILLDSLCPTLQTGDEVEQIVYLFKNLAQATGVNVAEIDTEKLRLTIGNDRIDYLYNHTKNYGFEMTREQFTLLYSVAMTNARSCRVYKPTKLPSKIDVSLFRATDAYQDKPKDYGWNKWIQKPVRIYDIKADHFSIVDKGPIQEVAQKILEMYHEGISSKTRA
jgi:polyketide synthase PksM